MSHAFLKSPWTLSGIALALAALGLAAWWWATDPLRRIEQAYARGDWTGAVKAGSELLRTDPGSRRATLWVARSNFALGNWGEAERNFSTVGDLDAADRRMRAATLAHLGNWNQSAELYEELLQEGWTDPDLLQQFVTVLIPQGKHDRAIELGLELSQIPSHRRAAWFLLATSYYQKTDYASTVAYFERLLDDDPNLLDPVTQRSTFWEDLGSALFKLGRLDESQRQLERAVVLHPIPEILDLLAQVHEARGNDDRAEQFWLQVLAADPNSLSALRSLARLELRRSQPEKSIEYLGRVLELAPLDVFTHANLAAAYLRAGQTAQAAPHTKRAEQLRLLEDLREQLAAYGQPKPHGPESQMLLAMRDIEQQRVLQAENRLRDLLDEFPDFAPAQRLLQLLNSQKERP